MKIKIFATVIYLFSTLLFAQTDSLHLSADEIQSLVDKLGVKLLLNDDQKTEISIMLSTYSSDVEKLRADGGNFDEKKKVLIDELDKKIKVVLDDKQEMKYDILKKDWWESVKTKEQD
jgi:hypothetical protein